MVSNAEAIVDKDHMMRHNANFRRVVVLGAMLIGAVLVGCGTERFEEASIRRWENIGAVNRAVYAREQECPERLRKIGNLIEATGPYHEKRLAFTLDLLQSKQQAERDRWPARRARAENDYRKRMAGDPDNIPDAVAGMWY
ncbi:MAG: hypothetical protein DHS20C16_06960 [Phycisphaerae bacterium]|nr:MAG: hypothetical protein DHS20C16_06960 [Phycisphaerae bacterium]